MEMRTGGDVGGLWVGNDLTLMTEVGEWVTLVRDQNKAHVAARTRGDTDPWRHIPVATRTSEDWEPLVRAEDKTDQGGEWVKLGNDQNEPTNWRKGNTRGDKLKKGVNYCHVLKYREMSLFIL